MLNWRILSFCNQGSLVSTIVDQFLGGCCLLTISWWTIFLLLRKPAWPIGPLLGTFMLATMEACMANMPPSMDFYAAATSCCSPRQGQHRQLQFCQQVCPENMEVKASVCWSEKENKLRSFKKRTDLQGWDISDGFKDHIELGDIVFDADRWY